MYPSPRMSLENPCQRAGSLFLGSYDEPYPVRDRLFAQDLHVRCYLMHVEEVAAQTVKVYLFPVGVWIGFEGADGFLHGSESFLHGSENCMAGFFERHPPGGEGVGTLLRVVLLLVMLSVCSRRGDEK